MTDLDVRYFKDKLESLETELCAALAQQNEQADTVVLDQSKVGRLSRIDAMQAQQMALEANRRRERQLLAVRAALVRIQTGEFGYCTECDEPINPKRLDFDPTLKCCVSCADQSD